MNLLQEEIRNKESTIQQLTRQEENLKRAIRLQVSIIDFAHISSFMLSHNDKILNRVKLVHERKLLKIGFKSIEEGHDPQRVIFNFSSHELNDAEKRLLSKGLSLSIPPKELNYGDALLPFELLFREVNNATNIPAESLNACRGALQFQAFDMRNSFDPKKEQNLLPDEINALRTLKADQSIIIQKSDKGNSVVLLDKDTYKLRMEELLADTTKFEKVNVAPGKDYNHLWNQELKVRDTLRAIADTKAISEDVYIRLCPSGSRPGIMYGLAKVHKQLVDGFPKLRPILSAINTPTYKLAKHLVTIMEPLTRNEHTVKDSFSFAHDIRSQNSKLWMSSFDVDSLFTNIPLEETINICCDELFKSTPTVAGLTKPQFRSLLELTTKDSFILFNGVYYRQIDGVAMGSPLGPTLANIFLCYHERHWLSQCPNGFKPLYFKRYVDDIFCLFNDSTQVQGFLDYLNARHPNMNFTFEVESNNSLSFLDVNVNRYNENFLTSLYRKPTFSGVYTNFNSFLPELYKQSLVSTLMFRIYTICSSWELINKEVTNLRKILRGNAYPATLLDKLIKTFFSRMKNRVPVHTVPKQKFQIVLPFLGSVSGIVQKKLKSLARKYLPASDIIVIFKSPARLSSVFSFKDKLPAYLLSGVVYKYTCSRCKSTYIGKTKRHTHHRFCEHAGISPLTGKQVKKTLKNATTVRDHMLTCDTVVSKDNFEIIGRDTVNFYLRIKESLFIQRDGPNLNIQGKSIPLVLF